MAQAIGANTRETITAKYFMQYPEQKPTDAVVEAASMKLRQRNGNKVKGEMYKRKEKAPRS